MHSKEIQKEEQITKMSRKGSKNFTESEKKLLISIINDYEVVDLSDSEMMEILSQKLGRSIKETSYYALKNEAKKNRPTPAQWLDNFCRFGIVEFYERRFQELLYVQRAMLKLYADEANKKDTVKKQNRVLMTRMIKTISDNSKNLAEMGTSPLIIAKLQSLIPKELLNGDLESIDKYFENMDENKKILWSIDSDSCNNNEEKELKVNPCDADTALMPPIPVEENQKGREGEGEKDATAQGDQRIF